MNEETSLSAEDEGRLDDFYRAMEKESSRFVGYPSSGVFDYFGSLSIPSFPSEQCR